MDPLETKKPRTLEKSELGPGTFQPEQQANPNQDSEFVKIHIELVKHLKDLDAQNEMDEVQGRAAREQFPDYPNFEAGLSSKQLEAGDKQGTTSSGVLTATATLMKSPSDPDQPDYAGDKQGTTCSGVLTATATLMKSPSDPDQPDSAGDKQGTTSSGVLTAIETSMKSPFDPDQIDSAGLALSTEQKMKKPVSITVIDLNESPGTGIHITYAESPIVDIPSNDTKRREIDLNRPYAEGEYEDVPNESADAGNLPEVSDDLNRPYAEGEYEDVPNESADAGNLPEVFDDLNRPYAEGEYEDVPNDSADAGNLPEVSDDLNRPYAEGEYEDVPIESADAGNLPEVSDNLNPPDAEGESEDVSYESADSGNLPEVSDDLNRPYAEGEYEDVPDESADAENLPEVSDDLNRPYAKGESEDVPNESVDAANLPEVFDEQLIKDEEDQVKILREVLDGADEDAMDELKSQLVGRSPPQVHVQKGSLYALCEESLKLLKQYFTKARGPSFWYLGTVQKIMKDAGKLNWLVDVLVEREIAQDFVTIWASQSETSDGYYKFAAEDRHQLSRITATLLAGIGERKVYANQEARYALLKTWLLPLCDDIGRSYAWSGIDLESIEYGLVGTIFSLPEPMQHEILSDWVGKHPNSADKWPPLLAWYELWWSKPF